MTDLEIIFCINANNIQKNKIRADYGIGYDVELIRLIENIQKLGIEINSVVITMYTGQEEVEKLIAERQAARKAKDFKRADAIRDELLAMGIILKDTREGVKWTKA